MAIKIGGEYYPSQEWYDASQQLKTQGKTVTTSAVKSILAGGTTPKVDTTPSPTRVELESKIQSTKDLLSSAQTTLSKAKEAGYTTGEIPDSFFEADTTKDVEGGQGTPVLPAPEAGDIYADFTTSLATMLDNQRTYVDNAIQKQIDDAKAQRDIEQKKYDEWADKQKEVLDMADPTKTATYEQEQRIRQNKLDAAEAASLTLEENFAANQKLVNELEGLYTDIQNAVEREKDITGLASIREPRIEKSVEEATARVGVIEAVMASRTGQLTEAHRAIDKSAEAMGAARTDQINYYNALLAFYGEEKGVAGEKIIQLTADEKQAVQDKVDLLERDMETTRLNIENIKQAMMDPDTAYAYGEAGVTLNDSPEQINEKLKIFSYTQELSNTSNSMAEQGYKALVGTAPAGSDIVTTTDSKGVQKSWYKEAEDKMLSVSEAKSLGVPYGTTQSQAIGLSPGESVNQEFQLAEEYVNSRTDLSDDQLKKELLRDSELTAGDINAIINARVRVVDIVGLSEKILAKVYDKALFQSTATELKKAKDAALELVSQSQKNNNQILVGGDLITLSDQDIIDLKNAISSATDPKRIKEVKKTL